MIQVINPLFILILVPICESLLFPCMAKLRIPNGYEIDLRLNYPQTNQFLNDEIELELS